jgi:arylsulfatase A-like enzyme
LVERTRENAGQKPATLQNDAVKKDERGIPNTVSAETHAYRNFAGKIGRTMVQSEPDWPLRPKAPERAPNIVVILCDDVGYSDFGCFGSEIPTPNIDRLAEEGLRYTNFHVMPMCSPTRAALLTGRNSHAAGVGWVAHADPGFPGYAMELPEDVTTIPETLQAQGYATYMVGKWHLCKDFDHTETASRASWPVQRGFDRFYGFLEAFSNYHHPSTLMVDNTEVAPERYPDGYYLTDDLTDRAVSMIRASKASDASKPVFLYFAHPAVHAPLHAKVEDIEQQRGRYEQGWDAIRAARFRKQIDLGLVAADTKLPPRNSEPGDDVKPWAELTADEQRLFARYMEVYAAMIGTIDESVGRIRQTLEELGEWDHTLVILTSDNGASREGQEIGTTQYFDALRMFYDKKTTDSIDRDLTALDIIGGPTSMPHYPRGWAMASNTPFRLYKGNTHAGGHRVPMVMSWPARLRDVAGQMRSQYVHITDLYPTLLDLTGVEDLPVRRGVPVRALSGASFEPTVLHAEAAHAHVSQYYELSGHRGYYEAGWEIVSRHAPMTKFTDDEFELYDLTVDPTETTNLAGAEPERVRRLARVWEQAAWDNQVFPLDEGSGIRKFQRSEYELRYETPVRLVPGTPTLARYRSLKLVDQRSFDIEIDLDFRSGDRGTLVAHGQQGGGYSIYIDNDEVRYVHNGYGVTTEVNGGAVSAGRRQIVISATAKSATELDVAISVDGVKRREQRGLAMLIGQALFQGIDVGIDRRSPVCWERFASDGTFAFSGKLESVTYRPGPHAPGVGPERLEQLRRLAERFD